jgi:hypothetical protein
MTKYRDDKAGIRGHKNRTIQFPKPDHPVSLGQVSTSAIGSSSNNQFRAPPWRNSEGRGRRQQEHYPVPYFSIGPPMPRPWGPPPIMYPPYPPWVGWYGPWTPPPMPFHLGWPGPAGGFGHRGYQAGDSHYAGVDQQ